jgi:hypothetical protein
MLCDGRAVFYTFTPKQFDELLEDMANVDNECLNTHLDMDLTFAPEQTGHEAFNIDNGFALQCYYTFSHKPHRATLAGDDGVRVRIAFSVAYGKAPQQRVTVMYADVPLFDSNNNSRLHIHKPDQQVVLRFVH